jgi:hypothetical protein
MNIRRTLGPRITDAVSGLGSGLALVSPFPFWRAWPERPRVVLPPHRNHLALTKTCPEPLISAP